MSGVPAWESWVLAALMLLSAGLLSFSAHGLEARVALVETQHAEILKAMGVLPSMAERLGRIEQHLLEGGRPRAH